MKSIDVHDLPEEQAKLVQAFVEFLRGRLLEDSDEREWTAGSAMSFADDWDNEEDAIYDNWKQHYGLSER